MLRILHVIDRLGAGGPSRGLIAMAAVGARLGLAHRHRLACLAPGAYPPLRLAALRAGIAMRHVPDAARLADGVAWADIVIVHYWNTPAITAFVEMYDAAPRLVLWLHVLGRYPPQVACESIMQRADCVVVTSPTTLQEPAFADAQAWADRCAVVPSIIDASRLAGFARREHDDFVVTYVGTLNAGKIHPGFLRMSAAARIPRVRFIVCGDEEGPWRKQAERLGVADRFEFCGFVEDIRPVLEAADVFGYPLAADGYATCDRSLQEAMWCGIPPVIFGHGGIAWMVEHGRTGLIVDSEAAYTSALEHLHAQPHERAALGAAAAVHATTAFDAEALTRRLDHLLRCSAGAPSRRTPPVPPGERFSAARRFARALGSHGTAFRDSLDAPTPDRMRAAEAEIAAMPAVQVQVEGGLFHYRNACRDDGFLRFWSGLALFGAGRFAAARDEFAAAIDRGCRSPRLEGWLARTGAAEMAARDRHSDES